MTNNPDPPEPIDVPLGDELTSPIGEEPLSPDAVFEYTNPAPEQLEKLTSSQPLPEDLLSVPTPDEEIAKTSYTNPAPEQLLSLEDPLLTEKPVSTKRPIGLEPPPRVNTNRPRKPLAPPMPPPRVNTNRPIDPIAPPPPPPPRVNTNRPAPFSPEIAPSPGKESADDGAD